MMCQLYQPLDQSQSSTHLTASFSYATNKSKVYGFVTFKRVDGAVKALVDPSKKIDGRITVARLASARDVANNNNVENRKVYVGNVPWEVGSGRTSYSGYPDRPSLLPHHNPPPSGTSSGPGYVNQVPPSYSSSGYPAGTGYNSGGYASAVAAVQELPNTPNMPPAGPRGLHGGMYQGGHPYY
nr:UBP1-associated protein 2C-like [Tanacetum cinerariifolium]